MTAMTSPRTLLATNTVPPTQNTAPVLEFRCLYTSDLRRKQKRWQDGRLKYHTFNKRIMVYDERSNFVGDTHWREDCNFEEGEEVELERNGILVQVSECIGRREQDLAELLDKRTKNREERFISRQNASSLLRAPLGLPRSLQAPMACLKPQDPSRLHLQTSLSRVRSHPPPLQLDETGTASQGPAKRRRLNKSPPIRTGYAQNLTGATLSLSWSAYRTSSATRPKDPVWVGISRQQQQVPTVDLILDSSSYEESLLKGQHNVSTAERSPSVESPNTNLTTKDKQTKMRAGISSPSRAGYAKNITRTVLNLDGRHSMRDTVAPIKSNETSKFQSSAAVVRQNEILNTQFDVSKRSGQEQFDSEPAKENGFIDIKAFRSNTSRDESRTHQRVNLTAPVVYGKAKRIGLHRNLSSRKSLTETQTKAIDDVQPEKTKHDLPCNPLRLKSRPKKKLLHMANHDCQPGSLIGSLTTNGVLRADSRSNNSETIHPHVMEGFKATTLDQEDLANIPIVDYNISSALNGHRVRGGPISPATPSKLSREAMLPTEGTGIRNQATSNVAYETSRAHFMASSTKSIGRVDTKRGRDENNLDDHLASVFETDNGDQCPEQTMFKSASCAYPEPSVILPTIVDDCYSSPADRGIDHLSIDALLCRYVTLEGVMTAKAPAKRLKRKKNSDFQKIFEPIPKDPEQHFEIHDSSVATHVAYNLETAATGKLTSKPIEQIQTRTSPLKEPKQPLVEKQLVTHRPDNQSQLARRSQPGVTQTPNRKTRSKEVVGFTVSIEADPEAAQVSQQTIEKAVESREPLPLQVPSKLANPASRGKKAASKADAAGKVPETVVPPVPPMAPPPRPALKKTIRSSDETVVLKSHPNLLKDGPQTGPWSPEAYDLFDCKPQTY